MNSFRQFASLVLVVVLALALFSVLGAPRPTAGRVSAPTIADDLDLGSRLPFTSTSRYFDPALDSATGRVSVLVAMDASASVAEVASLLRGPRVVPAIGGVHLVRGMIDADKIDELRSLPSVFGILRDRPIEWFDALIQKPKLSPRLPINLDMLSLPESSSTFREPLFGAGTPEVSMRDVVNFTGARRAWTELGVDGTGVTIAIVDTGVDHGAFNLGNGSAARNAAGWPISFDPDGSTVGWTFDVLTSYTVGSDTFLPTAGTDPLMYVFFPGGGPAAFLWSDIFGGPFPFPFLGPNPGDMNITGLPPSMSGNYSFGVLFEWNFNIDFFPAILIDTVTPGVYDTAYLDLSFDYWLYFGATPQPDFSFGDEPALIPAGGNVVASRDFNADGYPDISAGSLAYSLDVWGLDPNPPGFMILKPIDPAGTYMAMVYDLFGHGTSVAASAAGRESNDPLAGPGTAPGAQIMGVPIFNWFDIIEGWLWAAGFDLVGQTIPGFVPNYGVVYGLWTYTGNHKADIISNSWGSSQWVLFQPWYDVLTVVEDALMTPGYPDPSYPGSVMVHAAGNGAAGYGTVTEPAYSNLAITVGASTSMNWTELIWGTAGGFHFDVMSWSGRGPSGLGVPKPDVLQVGAFAWAAGPVWSGFGDGSTAVTLFGGTSQATPVTSGSAAVVIQAYQNANGVRPSPFVVKSILKSTAMDIGYDSFTQGAGHVDVYNAARYALGTAGIKTTTPASWDNVRPRIADAWATAALSYGEQISVGPPGGPIPDTSWYAGSVRPGSSTSAVFTTTAAAGTASGSISAVWHTRIASLEFNNTTTDLGPGWVGGFGGFGYLWPLPTPIPAGADLMVVRSVMPYDFFDPDGNFARDNRTHIVVLDWVDANGDTVIDQNETRVFNWGADAGTTSEARVGMPAGRFAGVPVMWLSQVPFAGVFVPMEFVIQVEFYDRVAWPWITTPATFATTSPAVWTATLAVPANADPGLYEGQILVTPTGGNTNAIPVSVIVPRVIDASTISASLTSPGSTQIYDSSSVNGYFDWSWRYEAGDWKEWFIDVVDPNVVSMLVNVAWTGSRTDVDVFSILPNGMFGDSSESPHLGSGTFLWDTRTGTTADWVQINTWSGLDAPAPGLYTILLHNVLLEGLGTAVPEPLSGTVDVAKLTPRGPLTVVTQPGEVLILPFNLSTGFDLTNVSFGAPPFGFPTSTTPGFDPLVAAGESVLYTATVYVPAETADGTYVTYFVLFANEFPMDPPVLVRVNIIVDSTNPGVSILAPSANAHVAGTATLQAAVADGNNVASVTFTAGAAAGAMTRDPVTGLWTATWVTTGTTDGSATVAVTATDTAGNIATSSRGVTVDNTAPSATFSAPAANTWVHGTVTASFTASDANLETATLTYGGTTVVVTGASTAPVDTGRLADGAQTLTLAVVDKAGNLRTATLSVNVDNTSPTAVLTSPKAAAHLRGSVDASFVATDANVDTATLTIGTLSIDVEGKTTQTINTASIADGTYTMTLTVTDIAANTATSSASVTVDNTAPTVTISSPAANANLRGATTITWAVTEANPDQVWLIIDGEQRDVTAQTSYAWDTSSVGDGAHTVVVQAVDKAGNVGTSTATVTTDNVASAVSTGFTNGLLIGLVAAAVGGLLIGWFIGRRRKKEEQPSLKTPPRPTEEEEL